jgi:Ca-activated chloride channel homolog
VRIVLPSDSSPPSRHRRRHPRRRRGAVLAGTTVLLVASIATAVLAASASGGAHKDGVSSACAGGVPTLQVIAAPEVAAAVAAAGQDVARTTGSRCEIAVTARPSAEVAAGLSTPKVRPDVWIPDSSIWVRDVAAAGLDRFGHAPSIARTPVVVAVSEKVARQHGWPGQRLSLSRLIGSVRLGLASPAQSAATIGAVLGLQSALHSAPDGPAAVASELRRAMSGLPADPARSLAGVGDPNPTAVATSEQAVWTRNVQGQPPRAVAGYLPTDAMTLDYPFLVLTSAPAARAAANRLLASLQHGLGRDRLLASGFRGVSDGRGPALRANLGVDPSGEPSIMVPSAATVAAAVRTLRVVSLDSRLLAVIDVSGSMGTPVPGAGAATRLDLVTAAASRGLGLYPDQAEIGLWVFATDLTARTDYRELVPIGPLATRPDGVTGRERLVQALGAVRRVPNGNTGLYDTTLAAVRAVRRGWDPQRANSVVVLTDGRNDDSSGIGLTQLLRTLRQESVPGRSVPVITIAYGADSDAKALGAISTATGGRLYLAPDPRRIDQVFLDAIGRRVCSAGTC